MVEIALAAIHFLAPYFAKGGEKFAEKSGEKLFDAVSNLYNTIKGKFKGDAYAEQTLARVESKPSEGAETSLKELLTEYLEKDPAFKRTIEQLLQEADQYAGNTVVASGKRSVAIGGNSTGNISSGDTYNGN